MTSSISVIIPTRDPGPFLDDTLASVMAQTRPPTSVIVVDDGSRDETVVDSVARFPDVRFLRQVPLGRSAARNRGAAATDSDLLLFLDHDDLLRSDALKTMGAALDADPGLEMVHGRVAEFVDERFPPRAGNRNTASEVSVRHCGSTLLRRSLWVRIGELDERLVRGEWIDWISRAQQEGVSVAHLDEVVMARRLHAFHGVTPGDDSSQYLKVIRAALHRKRQELGHE